MEVWKAIPQMMGYEASNLGNIRNTNWRSPGRVRLLTPVPDRDGYLKVCLSPNGQQRNYSVHRLVALTFIPNPEGKSQVNHINEVKDDNRVDNLEWMDCVENNNDGSRNLRVSLGKRNRNAYPVKQYDAKGNLIATWKSAHEVQRQLGYNHAFIARCCTGKANTAYGYKWRYHIEGGENANDPGNFSGNEGADRNPAEARQSSGDSD